MQSDKFPTERQAPDHYTTLEVAKILGMAVRSVQLMVDRNELEAWKTPGGHRRISRTSVERWASAHGLAGADSAPSSSAPPLAPATRPPVSRAPSATPASVRTPQILLIEDSVHFQNLVGLIVKQHFPEAALQVANDGITGLALYGQIQPEVLIVDILLPGIDGATLITTLRSHPQFARSYLIVVTSLDEAQREPYAFALQGVEVIHKPRLVAELPAVLAACLPTGPVTS
ncbi:excisionase [Acidovorax sp. GW101-3H11]|uniref:helix-turn-helix domain-containing protein n=1 Tax=Acidovorax sp. GW101-3H11 TaxID=1813946 RepID=UPI0007B4F892|nr:helix-turn-helix domain-containing protein [Acidovorax sp. GW101-3H11]KZT13843.1 excisionase [Acidovorax sp. GW101-3H11]